MGRNKEAVEDAMRAAERNANSLAAKEALGKALYSNGQFEMALVEFHRANRIRPNEVFDEWIGRCEETIRVFLTNTKLDCNVVEKLLLEKDSSSRKNDTEEPTKKPKENVAEKKVRERREKNEDKKTGLLMGKLHDDMVFLDKISKHPALQNNLLMFGEDKTKLRETDKVLKVIRGAALDGLDFLQVRQTFWETSLPPLVKDTKHSTNRRSKSESRIKNQ